VWLQGFRRTMDRFDSALIRGAGNAPATNAEWAQRQAAKPTLSEAAYRLIERSLMDGGRRRS
ncbi:hypothetical protein, partial [Bradyrhizobium sp. P5_C11_2]